MAKKHAANQTESPAFGAEDFSAEVSAHVVPLDSPELPASSSVPDGCFIGTDGKLYRAMHVQQENGSWKDWSELA